MNNSCRINKNKLSDDFTDFLRDRAKLVVAAMSALSEGDSPSLNPLWSEHLAHGAPAAGNA